MRHPSASIPSIIAQRAVAAAAGSSAEMKVPSATPAARMSASWPTWWSILSAIRSSASSSSGGVLSNWNWCGRSCAKLAYAWAAAIRSRGAPSYPVYYMNYLPAVEPSNFDACPILLTQPAEDRWSPLKLSQPVLSRITRVPVKTVMLTNAGHYPIEVPGLQQMQDAIAEFEHAKGHETARNDLRKRSWC